MVDGSLDGGSVEGDEGELGSHEEGGAQSEHQGQDEKTYGHGAGDSTGSPLSIACVANSAQP
ncbi:hypothetical protein DUHN55_21720 [Helicobacter pylori]